MNNQLTDEQIENATITGFKAAAPHIDWEKVTPRQKQWCRNLVTAAAPHLQYAPIRATLSNSAIEAVCGQVRDLMVAHRETNTSPSQEALTYQEYLTVKNSLMFGVLPNNVVRDSIMRKLTLPHCPACLLGQTFDDGNGLHLENSVEHPAVFQPFEYKEAERAAILQRDRAAIEYPRLVVCAILIRNGKVLLERRAPNGIDGLDGAWDLPGGKVECGETPREAVVREIREELSVEIECVRVLGEAIPSVWKYKDGIRHWLLVGCVCRIVSGDPIETDHLKWFSLSALPGELLRADRMLISFCAPEVAQDGDFEYKEAEPHDGWGATRESSWWAQGVEAEPQSDAEIVRRMKDAHDNCRSYRSEDAWAAALKVAREAIEAPLRAQLAKVTAHNVNWVVCHDCGGKQIFTRDGDTLTVRHDCFNGKHSQAVFAELTARAKRAEAHNAYQEAKIAELQARLERMEAEPSDGEVDEIAAILGTHAPLGRPHAGSVAAQWLIRSRKQPAPAKTLEPYIESGGNGLLIVWDTAGERRVSLLTHDRATAEKRLAELKGAASE